MTSRARWSCLLVCAVLIAVRAPVLLIEPRLWIEEGTVYLPYAFSQNALRTLLFIPTAHGPAGYILLPANLAAILSAKVFPLELAALVSTLTAFLAQLAPIAVVLWGRSRFWSTPARQLAVCALLVFTPAVRATVWLQVINSQLFCGLVAFLLLFEELRGAGRRRLWIYRLALVFCGLSGAYTAFLALPYYLRARLDRSREAWIHFSIVAGSALVHLVIYAATLLASPITPDRLGGPHLGAYPVVVLLQHLVQPILGTPLTDRLDRVLSDTGLASTSVGATVAGGVSLLTLVAFGYWMLRRRHDRFFQLLAVSFVVLSVATSILGFGLPRERYAVLSGVIVALALLVAGWKKSEEVSPRRRVVCQALTGVGLTVGLATYWLDTPIETHGGVSHFGYGEGRPDWREEVRQWRRDPGHQLRIWPYSANDSWGTYLIRREELRAFRSQLDVVDSFHLFTADRAAERRIALRDLPADFRVVVHARSDRPPEQVQLTATFEDADHQPVTQARRVWWRYVGQPFLKHGMPRQFEPLPGRRLAEARFFTLRAESLDRRPALVRVDRVEFLPRVEALLDDLLPDPALPTRLYHASPARPLAGEATPVLALESLRRDGDLVYSGADAERAGQRWRQGSLGLELHAGVYREPLPFLLAALPWARAGPSGVVAMNVALLAAMLALVWRDVRSRRLEGRLYAAGALLAAAGVGFVFLPQSQVFEMFCLFVSVRWWIRGELTGVRLAASGVLLAAAIVQEPAWAAVAVVLAADLWIGRRRRAVVALAAMTVALVAAATLAPRCLAQPEAATSVPTVASEESDDEGEKPAGVLELGANVWRFYTSRAGLIAGYPFVILAVVLFFRGDVESSRLLLFVALAVLTAWIAVTGSGSGPLGDPRFAAIYPLFLFLPTQAGSWRTLIAPSVVALLFTLGVVSTVWGPA